MVRVMGCAPCREQHAAESSSNYGCCSALSLWPRELAPAALIDDSRRAQRSFGYGLFRCRWHSRLCAIQHTVDDEAPLI